MCFEFTCRLGNTRTAMRLIEVIYTSTATRAMGDEDLRSILDTSVRRNTHDGVTGLLLFANAIFLQAVEGPAASIDALLARLESDPRHHAITILSHTEVTQRNFAQWSMGFKQLAPQDLIDHPHFAPFFTPGFDPSHLGQPGLALDILKSLAHDIAG